MSLPNPDDMLLLIRCPSCGQRFKVGEDLRGRTVECGGCEHRFRIQDEVIVRGKKFYPGERKDPTLNRFHRVPISMAHVTPSVATVQYADPPDQAIFEPASPLRIIAGIVGGTGIALMALLLMFGASRGGALDGMVIGNRVVMAVFTGLLGAVLLVYANPRNPMKAFGIGVVLTAMLAALPFLFTVGSIPMQQDVAAAWLAPAVVPEAVDLEDENITTLRALIGTEPLQNEIERLASEGGGRKAVGLWLRNLREANRYLVRDYILRMTGAGYQSHYYPRGDGDFLMVVTGIEQSLKEVAEVAASLGTVARIYDEIQVVEVRVNNESFLAGPMDRLTDKTHPAFYDLNKRELESIDLARISQAVKRLAEVEPKIYRSDISRKLILLLGEPWVDFKGDLCRALAVWSEKPGPAGEVALVEVKSLIEKEKEVPEEMIALLVKEKTPGVAEAVDQLWSRNPMRWESAYGDLGADAESTLIRRFPETEGSLRHSAVRVFGRVGGAESLPLLEAADEGADVELKVLLRNSIASIRGRAAR